MNNQEKKYELIKFEDGDFSLDVNVSPNEETVWLNVHDLAHLFERDEKTIRKHINNALKEECINSTVAKFATVQNEGNRKVTREIEYFNLDIITYVGYRVKSNRGIKFREWALTTLEQLKTKNGSTKPLIVFKHNEITLDVTVSPDEDTVWLTKDQITLLYETTRQNVEYHINNIYTQKELEEWATCKEILQVQNENNRLVTRTVNIYNLDMIISLGYRINSKNAIIFRK